MAMALDGMNLNYMARAAAAGIIAALAAAVGIIVAQSLYR